MSTGMWLLIHTSVIMSIILCLRVVRLLDAKKKEALAREQESLKRAALLEVITKERLDKRIESSSRFIDLIRVLIEDQVYGRLQLLEVLKQPYPIRELDNDVKEMSDKVFKSISTSAYKSSDNILSEDAILNFIVDQTTIILSNAASEYNSKMYAQAANLE